MTLERVAFDTWAWFEVFADNTTGNRLVRNYLDNPEVRVLTPSLALAEMSAKLARSDQPDRIPSTLQAMDGGSEVVHLSTAAAAKVGPILVELRKISRKAGMADAVMLAVARDNGAKLVSGDEAFEGQPDVVRA